MICIKMCGGFVLFTISANFKQIFFMKFVFLDNHTFIFLGIDIHQTFALIISHSPYNFEVTLFDQMKNVQLRGKKNEKK